MVPGFSLWRTANEIARARHIAEVLVRNGLGALAQSIGLTRFIPRWRARRKDSDDPSARLTMPQRVRRSLEELGPTYIKLGQILSTRPDILPPDYIVELAKLLDATPPVPFALIQTEIEAELGAPLETLYADVDPQPIASASIGQVHRASLPDGRQVVIKVRRPGIEGTVEADLGLLATQARFLEKRSDTLKSYGITALVAEFSQALRDELDYTSEGRNVDRVRALVQDDGVLVPEVDWERTTRRVITLSDLHGIKLSERQALLNHGYDLSQIAARTVQVYLKLVFEHGVFHADPHPANILVCDGQIGLVDFGVVGYLTPRMKEDLGDLLFALVRQDAEERCT